MVIICIWYPVNMSRISLGTLKFGNLIKHKVNEDNLKTDNESNFDFKFLFEIEISNLNQDNLWWLYAFVNMTRISFGTLELAVLVSMQWVKKSKIAN